MYLFIHLLFKTVLKWLIFSTKSLQVSPFIYFTSKLFSTCNECPLHMSIVLYFYSGQVFELKLSLRNTEAILLLFMLNIWNLFKKPRNTSQCKEWGISHKFGKLWLVSFYEGVHKNWKHYFITACLATWPSPKDGYFFYIS